MGDGLFQLVFGPQPLCVRPILRAQGRLNLTLPPIPERKGHTQPGGHRFIARLPVVVALHADVRHAGFPFKSHGMLGLFRELGHTSYSGMLLKSLGCQLFYIQPLSGREEVSLDRELFAK